MSVDLTRLIAALRDTAEKATSSVAFRAALHYFHSLKYPKVNRTKEETTAALRAYVARKANG